MRGSARKPVGIGICALTALVAGCSSIPKTDTGQRGLFQKQDGERASLAIPSSAAAQRSDAGLIWPVKEGTVSSFFGKRKRDFHEGIDIRTSAGAPIFAASPGEVIYSARRIKGYGNMIVLRHAEGLATVYAHNRKNLVRRGERVRQGQLMGFVGATGKATGPHLHFEIRKGELAQDPLLFLPQLRSPAVAHR